MKTITQSNEATTGQIRQITTVGSDAVAKTVEEFGLDKDGAQRVYEHGDELAAEIRNITKAVLARLSVSNQYASEEVPSKYGYLSGYTRPMDIIPQTNKLRQLFKGLGFANQDLLKQIEKGEVKLLKNTEGWGAIPNWKKNPQIFGNSYAEAVQVVLNKIRETRDGKFYNYREGQIDAKHLRQSARSEAVWKKIMEAQNDADILIVPIQFGLRHRGRSVRRALEVMSGIEFGLGAFAVGCMLLVHPNRLQNYDDLWIDCSGDEWSPGGDGEFSGAPYLRFLGGRVEFGASGVSGAGGHCGAASGFFPQS
jgi:hypothetical protein